jgi:hypothetical protein
MEDFHVIMLHAKVNRIDVRLLTEKNLPHRRIPSGESRNRRATIRKLLKNEPVERAARTRPVHKRAILQ